MRHSLKKAFVDKRSKLLSEDSKVGFTSFVLQGQVFAQNIEVLKEQTGC